MRREGESDATLVAAAREGDRAAVEVLLTRHQGRIFRFGLRMCGHPDDAQEVLQETLLAAAHHLPGFRSESSVSTWLYTIARSFCIKRRRTSRFAPDDVSSLDRDDAREVPDPRRTPEDEAAAMQVRGALQQAILALEPMYREVLVLRDVEGLPASEVAEVLGLSVEAVKSRLHRARVAVRERVAPALGLGGEAAARPDPTCPDVVELFSRHLEGDMSGSVCAQLEGHLQGCSRCRARCDSLRATLDLCSRSGDEVPAQVAASVRSSLRRYLADAASSLAPDPVPRNR